MKNIFHVLSLFYVRFDVKKLALSVSVVHTGKIQTTIITTTIKIVCLCSWLVHRNHTYDVCSEGKKERTKIKIHTLFVSSLDECILLLLLYKTHGFT